MLFLPTPEDTDRLGLLLAQSLLANRQAITQLGLNIRLEGDLGRIKSPTFTLLETYPIDSEIEVFHFDFYRFESPEEFLDAGFRENFAPGHITFCEWSEKAGNCLPNADLTISLKPHDEGRQAFLTASTELGLNVLKAINEAWTSHAEH